MRPKFEERIAHVQYQIYPSILDDGYSAGLSKDMKKEYLGHSNYKHQSLLKSVVCFQTQDNA